MEGQARSSRNRRSRSNRNSRNNSRNSSLSRPQQNGRKYSMDNGIDPEIIDSQPGSSE